MGSYCRLSVLHTDDASRLSCRTLPIRLPDFRQYHNRHPRYGRYPDTRPFSLASVRCLKLPAVLKSFCRLHCPFLPLFPAKRSWSAPEIAFRSAFLQSVQFPLLHPVSHGCRDENYNTDLACIPSAASHLPAYLSQTAECWGQRNTNSWYTVRVQRDVAGHVLLHTLKMQQHLLSESALLFRPVDFV